MAFSVTQTKEDKELDVERHEKRCTRVKISELL